MSGVYKRLRKTPPTQFETNAVMLQVQLAQYCTKEKYVPKRYRLLLGIPIINKVNELVDNISFANSIYAGTKESIDLRNKYQTKAIANLIQLQNLIIALEITVDKVTIKSLEKVIELLNSELSLLKAWKKSDKKRFLSN